MEKFGVRLRPVEITDAARIVELRNSPHARGFLGDSATTVGDQEKWLMAYFERRGDYCFMIETLSGNSPVGMLGVYNIESEQGEMGRWIVQRGAMVAPASALLAWSFCFERLGLKSVVGLVVETNKEVLSFHRRLGCEEVGIHSQTRVIGGESVRMIEFLITQDLWPSIKRDLEKYAEMAQLFFP